MGQAANRKRDLERRGIALSKYLMDYRSAVFALRAKSPTSEQALAEPAAALGLMEIVMCSNAALVFIYPGAGQEVRLEQFAGTTRDFVSDPRCGLYDSAGARLAGSGIGVEAPSDNFLEIVAQAHVDETGRDYRPRWGRMLFVGHGAQLPDPHDEAAQFHEALLATMTSGGHQVH